MNPNEIIQLSKISASYNGNIVLEDIHLSVHENDFLGIIGPNGGGKSTLLKVILGLVKPDSGSVKIFGKNPLEASAMIGYVPQFRVFDRDFPISVWEVVLMGRLNHKGLLHNYTKEDKRIAHESLKIVDMLDYRDRQIGQLSEGQKQRVFIARALATQPKLLLLDEPTASVDTRMQVGLYELLHQLKKDLTIVLVSHDIGVISSYVNKVACLNRKLFYHGSSEIKPEDLEAAYQCPIEMIAHGVPHRVVKEHG